jgi:hypothetical protein
VIRICDLPRGWTLWANTECRGVPVVPVFRDQAGRELTVLQMAQRQEAPILLREIRRLVEIAKREGRLPGSDSWPTSPELGEIALGIALRSVEKWDPSLLDEGAIR